MSARGASLEAMAPIMPASKSYTSGSAKSGSQKASINSATSDATEKRSGSTNRSHGAFKMSAVTMTSSERPRCIVRADSVPNSRRPARWLFARRTPLATASILPRSVVKSVRMRSASPSGRARSTMARVLYERAWLTVSFSEDFAARTNAAEVRRGSFAFRRWAT